MKQSYKKMILTICICSISFFAFSQKANQVKEIQKEYDLTKLKNLEKKFQKKQSLEKQKATSLAQINGWPLTYIENGSYHELMFVTEDNKPIYYSTFNVDAATSTRANFMHSGGGLGLNVEGQGMTAHVWDGGLARTTHQEYDGPGGDNRFSIGDGTTALSFHSAHVTGTIIASGVDPSAKGMAPQANAVGYDWSNDEAEATGASANGMLLSNHSYGFRASTVPDSFFGAYLQPARDWDEIMYNAPYYLQVAAAGNDGNDNASNASPLEGNSSYDKITGLQTAKNGLVVANGQDANIDSNGALISMNINSGSSEGPMDDLRIKPDITGNGTQLLSSYESSDTAYNIISGTSMASPNVMGSLLLLQQHYNNINGSFMRAATLKGLALHTADDSGPVGPDAVYGWGLLNTKKAAETITDSGLLSSISEETLAQGETFSITVKSDGTNPLLASISWTDLPGTLSTGINSNTPALVNDLDIRITQTTSTFEPWRLTAVDANGKGDNIVDPYERVEVDGASGEYTITVTHKGTLSSGPQNFSLIVTGIEEDFSISATNVSQSVCSNTDATFDFNYRQLATTTTNFSVQNLPSGASSNLSSTSLNADGTISLVISGLENVALGTYEIDLIGDNGTETETKTVKLRVLYPTFDANPMSISSPMNEEKGIISSQPIIIEWNENLNAQSYRVEISDSPSFTTLLASGTETDLNFSFNTPTVDTIYYWRIKPINQCVEGGFSEVFSFQTGVEDCSNTYTATNFTDAPIDPFSTNVTAFVPITIDDDLTISRLIVQLDLTHSSVNHLNIFLQEPTELGSDNISLAPNLCAAIQADVNATFDDSGATISCAGTSPTISGTVAPAQTLATSVGQSSLGTWFVAAQDNTIFHGGQINGASITVCTSSPNTSLPSFTNNSISVTANATTVIAASSIEATTSAETASQQTYTVITLPTNGDVTKSGVSLSVGDTFTQEDVDLGNIAYVNTLTTTFSDSFKVDITNATNGWLPNQVINLVANVASADSFELRNFSIYPNPSNGVINIKFERESEDKIQIEMFDLQGRSIYTKRFTQNQYLFDESLNIGRVANGLYLLKVTQGNRSTTKRIIISK